MKREGNPSPKKWVKPILTVLVSGKPEESSLAGCKWNQGGGTVSPNGQVGRCAYSDVVVCHGCKASAIS